MKPPCSGALYQTTADGRIENIYTVKLINKTSQDLPVELRLENLPGDLRVMGDPAIVVPKEQLAQTSILIQLASEVLTGGRTDINIGVYSQGKRVAVVKTAFAGPRPAPPATTR